MAIHLAGSQAELLKPLEKAAESVRKDLRRCAICTTWTTGDLCPVCADEDRDAELLCVIEDLPDLEAFEAPGTWRGRYHVLHGRLSPSRGTGPGELSWQALLERLEQEPVRELVLATSLSVEGEATASELARSAADVTHPPGRITRIAAPAGAGAEPEYWEREEIAEALRARRPYAPPEPAPRRRTAVKPSRSRSKKPA